MVRILARFLPRNPGISKILIKSCKSFYTGKELKKLNLANRKFQSAISFKNNFTKIHLILIAITTVFLVSKSNQSFSNISKHRKGAFRARRAHQKFGYSVLKEMRALFSILRLLLLSKTQITSDITSKVWI